VSKSEINIQYGFRLSNKTFKEMHDIMQSFRKKLPTIAQEQLNIVVGKKVAYNYDMKTMNETHLKSKSVTEFVFNSMLADFESAVSKDEVNTDVDYEFTVVVFPDGNNFYGIIYTSQVELYKVFMSHPDISYFGYNTEKKPNDVSDQEWIHIGSVWNRVLLEKKIAIPEIHGITYTIISEEFMLNNYPTDTMLYDYTGSLEERAFDFSREIAFSRYIDGNPMVRDNPIIMTKIYKNFMDDISDGDGLIELNNIKDKIMKKLKLVITNFDDFDSKIITDNVIKFKS